MIVLKHTTAEAFFEGGPEVSLESKGFLVEMTMDSMSEALMRSEKQIRAANSSAELNSGIFFLIHLNRKQQLIVSLGSSEDDGEVGRDGD